MQHIQPRSNHGCLFASCVDVKKRKKAPMSMIPSQTETVLCFATNYTKTKCQWHNSTNRLDTTRLPPRCTCCTNSTAPFATKSLGLATIARTAKVDFQKVQTPRELGTGSLCAMLAVRWTAQRGGEEVTGAGAQAGPAASTSTIVDSIPHH